jgi:hypothetical protein
MSVLVCRREYRSDDSLGKPIVLIGVVAGADHGVAAIKQARRDRNMRGRPRRRKFGLSPCRAIYFGHDVHDAYDQFE